MKSGAHFVKQNVFTLGLLCLVGFLLSGCRPAEPEMVTVGVVTFVEAMSPVLEGFKEGMAEEGYIEGENISYIYEGAVPQEELKQIAQTLVESEVDILLSMGTPAAVAARDATKRTDIPVVFVPVTDPMGSSIVDSLSQPGGNITGITNGGSESRRLEWLLLLVPTVEKIYVPYNPKDPSAQAALVTATEGAAKLDVELILIEAGNDEEMLAAVTNIPEGVDAVFILPDSQAIKYIDETIAAALERNLPVSGPTVAEVEAGALVTFGIEFFEAGKQAARLANRILKGDKPADLPVVSAEFFLTINLATAEKIGLHIPDDILLQATTIIREDRQE